MFWLRIVGAYAPRMGGFSRALERFIKDERGATSLEYALVLIGIFLAIVSAIGFVGDEVQNFFDTTANTLTKMKNR